jgi:hypothetical protein
MEIMDRLYNVMAIFSLALTASVLFSLRRAHIRVEHSVSWLAAGVVLFVLSQWRALSEWLASALGTSDVAQALLIVTGALFLVVLYRQSLRISGLKDSNVKLAQQLAILEYRLNSLTEKNNG